MWLIKVTSCLNKDVSWSTKSASWSNGIVCCYFIFISCKSYCKLCFKIRVDFFVKIQNWGRFLHKNTLNVDIVTCRKSRAHKKWRKIWRDLRNIFCARNFVFVPGTGYSPSVYSFYKRSFFIRCPFRIYLKKFFQLKLRDLRDFFCARQCLRLR